ncbi:hypothetical protein MFLAVUS_005050 [Mucor flavus]|uniref:Uncharacterized protein n=1 Tax=Mucor flavus TaxID=439312 RepID=A0ABP9YXQ7_9FUNG
MENDGSKLYKKYVKDEKMFADELKRMSFGLSSILDLVDCCPEDQRSVIGEEIWNQLCNKYYNRYQIHLDSLQPKLEETLVIVETFILGSTVVKFGALCDFTITRNP